MANSPVSLELIKSTLLELLEQRGSDKSICPSEVARAISDNDWRSLMPQVRRVGWELAAVDIVLVTQKGKAVSDQAKGPVRFSQGDTFYAKSSDKKENI